MSELKMRLKEEIEAEQQRLKSFEPQDVAGLAIFTCIWATLDWVLGGDISSVDALLRSHEKMRKEPQVQSDVN